VYPALCGFDLVVEAHDTCAPVSTTLAARQGNRTSE
jgi:hypothetical protein